MKVNLQRNFLNGSAVQKNLQQYYEKPVIRVSFELVVSIVVVAVFALFALRPTLITMSSLLEEIDQKRELDKQLQQKIAALSTAQGEWAAYRTRVEQLQNAFYIDPSVEDVVLYLEYLARQENVIVVALNAPALNVKLDESSSTSTSTANQASSSNKILIPYQAGYSLLGDYESLMSYFRRVESLKPLMSIEAVQLNVNEKDENYPLSATMSLRIYAYQDQKTASKNAVNNPAIQTSKDR